METCTRAWRVTTVTRKCRRRVFLKAIGRFTVYTTLLAETVHGVISTAHSGSRYQPFLINWLDVQQPINVVVQQTIRHLTLKARLKAQATVERFRTRTFVNEAAHIFVLFIPDADDNKLHQE